MSSQKTFAGICPVCSKIQALHLVGDPDLVEPKPENFRINYHMDGPGEVCGGYNKPPTSLYYAQGSSAPQRHDDHDLFEVNREGEHVPVEGQDDWLDDHGPQAL